MNNEQQNEIIIYCNSWCPSCRITKTIFEEYDVVYEWIDIDQNPIASKKVEEINKGFRSVPTIIFPDGTVLVEPRRATLISKLLKI
jgi:mycoredoxin